MNNKTVIPRCHKCGSNDVLLDACVKWDINKQDWVLNNTFYEAICEDCGRECSYSMVNNKDIKQAKIKITEVVKGYAIVNFAIDETLEQLGMRVKEQLKHMGIRGFRDTLKVTHKEIDITDIKILKS